MKQIEKILLFTILINFSGSGYGQMQKIFNKNPYEKSYFGLYTSIDSGYILITSFPFSFNYGTYKYSIFKKKKKLWEEVFSYNLNSLDYDFRNYIGSEYNDNKFTIISNSNLDLEEPDTIKVFQKKMMMIFIFEI